MQTLQKNQEYKTAILIANEIKKNMDSFQKYYKNLTQKEYIPLQYILSISALSLLSKTKKLY